jgi:hypothetical protein
MVNNGLSQLLGETINTYVYDLINKVKTEYVPVEARTSVLGSDSYSKAFWTQQVTFGEPN